MWMTLPLCCEWGSVLECKPAVPSECREPCLRAVEERVVCPSLVMPVGMSLERRGIAAVR
jgi:hypothetical protein